MPSLVYFSPQLLECPHGRLAAMADFTRLSITFGMRFVTKRDQTRVGVSAVYDGMTIVHVNAACRIVSLVHMDSPDRCDNGELREAQRHAQQIIVAFAGSSEHLLAIRDSPRWV